MYSVIWRHLETMKPPKNLAYPKSRGKIMVMVFLNSFSLVEFDSNMILMPENSLHPTDYCTLRNIGCVCLSATVLDNFLCTATFSIDADIPIVLLYEFTY